MDYFKREFSTGAKDVEGNPDLSASQTSAIVSILSAGTFFVSSIALLAKAIFD